MMLRQSLTRPKTIALILFLQLIPLVLFPPSSFGPDTQEWWLPVLLAVLVLLAVYQLVFRHSFAQWPWYLVSFAQGFNIISRLMMIMPHATIIQNGVQVYDTLYLLLSVISMIISAFLLWYTELPEVRLGLSHD
jgi:hypothetical protein